MFEWNEEEAAWRRCTTPSRRQTRTTWRPATCAGARALAYDLVYNGVEVAGACAWLEPVCGCTSYFNGFCWFAGASIYSRRSCEHVKQSYMVVLGRLNMAVQWAPPGRMLPGNGIQKCSPCTPMQC